MEDAFQRLAMLTNEESLTAAARTLELASTRRIDRGVAELREINLNIGEDVLDAEVHSRKDVKPARRGA